MFVLPPGLLRGRDVEKPIVNQSVFGFFIQDAKLQPRGCEGEQPALRLLCVAAQEYMNANILSDLF